MAATQPIRIPITAIDKTQKAFRAVGRGLNRVKSSIISVQGAVAALGAGLALREFSQQIDELAKQSGLLGLTVNQLQQLQFAASQTGVTTAELNKGLERFSRSISEASTGIGVGKRSFDALGITLANSDGSLKSTSDLLAEVADKFATIKDPADKVRVAVDLFGRSGAGLVNTLADGSAGLKELGDDFNSVTLQLTGEQAEAVENANDLFDKLGRVFASVGQQITSVLLPALANVAKFLTVVLLKAISASTAGIRALLNEFVEFANQFEGINLEKFTFGKQLEKEIERITFNLDNAHRGVQMLEDGTLKFTVTSGKAAEQTSVFERHLDAFGDSAEKAKLPVSVMTDLLLAMDPTLERVSTNSAKAARNFLGINETLGAGKGPLEQYIDSTKDLKGALEDTAVSGLRRMEDAMLSLMKGTMSLKDAFRSMATSIIEDLMRIYIRRQITGVIADAIFGATTGPSYSMGSSPQTYGLEKRANGGPVSAGRPYLVGERGPELMVPNRSGTVVPNNAMGGGVTINQTVQITTGVQQTVRAEVMNMLPDIANATKGAVLDARRRGGSFAAAFG